MKKLKIYYLSIEQRKSNKKIAASNFFAAGELSNGEQKPANQRQ